MRVAAVVFVLLALAGAAAFITRSHGTESLFASGPASAASQTTTASTPTAPPPPTRLLALPSHKISNGTDPLKVTLSGPPAQDSPPPSLAPAVAGTWSVAGDAEVFTPTSTLEPCSSYTLTVWARTHATGGAILGHRHTIGLNVACPSIAAAQQALARLGYLGARFHPRYTVHLHAGRETRGEAASLAFHPPRGALVPDPSDAPPVSVGDLDATTRGALTVYQNIHGLSATGELNRDTWASLLSAETVYRRNPTPYTWVSVSESLPETLRVHHGHHVVYSTPVNTGVPGAETARGIFPIYSRFTSTTMSGTNVDGSKYVDPGIPWVNYFNGGDAVHGYPRGSYGFPQSNGCVELPIEAAHKVYGMLALGDIVEVGG